MNKKLILVAAPPACGKTYISKLIAKSLEHIVYLDKDDLGDLIRAAFAASCEKVDMDGEFYQNKLREAEYSTILDIAFSSLEFENCVILNAPFLKEVRDADYMRILKNKANEIDAELFLIWVTASPELCYERMKKRGSERDVLKLKNWQDYIKNINFNPPLELETKGAVDKLIVFNTNNDETMRDSLIKTLEQIKGERV
ncbi:MAG: AAA family ATPase [Clostridia bacterium]|nr:AAA family ATPase [Clostridia bacterium]